MCAHVFYAGMNHFYDVHGFIFSIYFLNFLVDGGVFLTSPTPLVVSDEQTDGQESLSQQQARMSASSATRELDELMASLSDFKVQSNVSMVQKWVDFGLLRTVIFGMCGCLELSCTGCLCSS